MSNSVYIPAQRMCTRCNYIGREDAEACKGCGISFIFGKPDKQPTIYNDEINRIADKYSNVPPARCLWDGIQTGQPMGMVCGCPKCSAYSLSSTSDSFWEDAKQRQAKVPGMTTADALSLSTHYSGEL